MPSLDHEALVQLFRNAPELAPQLLREALHIELPKYSGARTADSDLSQVVPAEFRADAVVLLEADKLGAGKKVVLGVVVEAQLGIDKGKPFSWPAYVGNVRAQHKCPVELLVLTHDPAVATWASAPISLDLGGRSLVTPRVLGPSAVPVVIDIEEAKRSPELAVLSALSHGGDDPELAGKVGIAAIVAVLGLNQERAALYSGLIHTALSNAARAVLENLMQTQSSPVQSEFVRIQRASAHTRDVLVVLETRGIRVSEEQRARISAESDLDVLDRWLRRAVTASSADELFG